MTGISFRVELEKIFVLRALHALFQKFGFWAYIEKGNIRVLRTSPRLTKQRYLFREKCVFHYFFCFVTKNVGEGGVTGLRPSLCGKCDHDRVNSPFFFSQWTNTNRSDGAVSDNPGPECSTFDISSSTSVFV